MSIDYPHLWQIVSDQFHGGWIGLHGPSHWKRVERNGTFLAAQNGANESVVKLFALFHDSRRENDGWDEGHGARGAEYALELFGTEYELEGEAFELLHYACVWHTDGTTHDDITIATCWDADRLDLGRVGVRPNPKRMCTDIGREVARAGSVERYLERET
jgi:uncharacterized protein